MNQAENDLNDAELALRNAISEDLPIVAVLGQSAGWKKSSLDTVLRSALNKLNIDGNSWSKIFSTGEINKEFYPWLNERFERRSPSPELLSLADTHLSAVYTSAIDPVIKNLFETESRKPEMVLSGNPVPPISRSKLKPRFYFLFGVTGSGAFEPPRNRFELNSRRTQHAAPMLATILDTATPLGLVVIDGISGRDDWLNISDLLGQISFAPKGSILWFGNKPDLDSEDSEFFSDLLNRGVICRDIRSLGLVLAEIKAAEIDDKSALREMQSESFGTILDSKLETIQDHFFCAEPRLASSADERKVLDSACSIVQGFIGLEMGWDGPDSFVPTEEVINDALTVLRNWPVPSFVPEPSAGVDGSIALELYNEDSFACGGIELIGNRIAIYSIIDDEKVVCFGRFDTSLQEEMVQALSKFKDYLG